MNKSRAQQLRDLIGKIEYCKNELEKIKSDEEDAYESMPENLQGSYRGEESERIIDELDEILDDYEELIDNLNNVL